MSDVIRTFKEAVFDRMGECRDVVKKRFEKSVGIVYAADENRKVTSLGSCIYMQVDGHKYLVTAAHVIDEADTVDLAASGSDKPFIIEGGAGITKKPPAGRKGDIADFAFLKLTDAQVVHFGDDVEFIDAGDVSLNRGTMEGRQFLVLGFPASKNKGLHSINMVEKKLTPRRWSYFDFCAALNDDDVRAIGLEPDINLLVKFSPDQCLDEDGNKANTISPKGVSGGALIDMSLPTIEGLDPSRECPGRLCGVMIEVRKNECLLVAVKIQHIIDAIRNFRD